MQRKKEEEKIIQTENDDPSGNAIYRRLRDNTLVSAVVLARMPTVAFVLTKPTESNSLVALSDESIIIINEIITNSGDEIIFTAAIYLLLHLVMELAKLLSHF